MTLIVGFKCGESCVLCADSQETRDTLKTEVNKLPIGLAENGGMDIVCGGAGIGDLADGFRSQLLSEMTRSKTQGLSAVKNELQQLLVEFHNGPVFKAFPGKAAEKFIAGLIAVRSAAREVFLFKFSSSVLEPIDTYGLAGEDYAFIEHIARRRYRAQPTINQAVVIGVEVVNEAKATSIYVGGPTRVVIVKPNEGVETQELARIAWTEEQILIQNQLFDDLRFDLSSTGAKAQERLQNFSNSITSMRGVCGEIRSVWG